MKANLNSKLYYSFPRELLSICSKLKRRKTILNCTSEESLLWMTVMNWFLNGWVSSRVLLTLKIYLLIFPENSFNITKSWRLLKRTSSRKLLNLLEKLLKMLKTSKNSMNNSEKILNSESMKILPTEIDLLNS